MLRVPGFALIPPKLMVLISGYASASLYASSIDSTTMNNLYLSVTPLFNAAIESSIDLITSLTPCGLANLIVVFRISFVGTSSLAIKIQSAPIVCVHEKATCPCNNRWSTLVNTIIFLPPKIRLLYFLIEPLGTKLDHFF